MQFHAFQTLYFTQFGYYEMTRRYILCNNRIYADARTTL